MTDKEREIWQKKRAKGKWRFILIDGILLLGIPVGISAYIGKFIFECFFYQVSYQKLFENWTFDLTFYLVWFLILSFPYGWWLWNKNEKDFSEKE